MSKFDGMDDEFGNPVSEIDTGLPETPKPKAPVPQAPDQFETDLTALYGKYGRTPTPEDVQVHRGNPGGLAAVENLLIKDWKPTAAPAQGSIDTSFKGDARSGYVAPPAARVDSSAQPVPNQSYDALNALLSQMFASQQARDAENAQYRGSIRNSILSRVNAVSQPKTMDSPEIAAQSKAFRTASDRGLRQNREALAERAHAAGLPSGAQDASVQGAYTASRRDQGAFDAKTLGDSLKQQRDELDQLLSIGAGSISADDMASIASYRDNLDAQLREVSTKQAGSLGQQDINLRSILGLGGLGIQQQSVNNQNSQANARFGLDFGNSQWEHDYLWHVLGLDK